VKIRPILKFSQSSEGQLSYDALKAFPNQLIENVEVFYWPVEKRERNQAGRPGKLHAKIAIVDNTALVSSANLTDDAFNRNLEVGVMVNNLTFLIKTKTYLESLINDRTLSRL
jgi:phosphatidylserine/phosphatidylglycerophosphate/cardiolipin synthase-like enzyme